MRPGRAFLASVAAVFLLASASTVQAGAWTRSKGRAQVIVKYERMSAERGYDASGDDLRLPAERRDSSIGVFAEYGLTDRLTLQFKGDWQDGEDAFVDYEGRGPVEIGATWQVWRDEKSAVSLYGGYASGGEGRNAGYAAPGVGDHDWEVRLSAGRSFGPGKRRWTPTGRFVEAQVARRFRASLPDETRIDLTHGSHYGENWMILSQAFAGAADRDARGREGARWLAVETSVVRKLGDWSVQAGWRRTVAGRETPISSGPVLAIWRRF